MRSHYKITDDQGVYFLTSTIVQWLPVFTSLQYFQILIDAFKFCQEQKGFQFFAYVILDNHFHCIAQAPDLSGTMASIKKFTAKMILQQIEKDHKSWLLNQLAYYKKRHKTESLHQVWQEGSHPQLIQSENMLVQKINYIHYNPVRRGLVEQPEHWRFSSARNFINGDQSTIRIDKLENF